jgi:peptide deformylase
MRSILVLPDPFLRLVSAPVDAFNGELRDLAAEMRQIMRTAEGIGLAAPQIGSGQQLLVMQLAPDKVLRQTVVLANPVIQSFGGLQRNNEGCLSVPGQRIMVERPNEVIVKALDERGKLKSFLLKGLAAACLLHEMDHFRGVLIPDYEPTAASPGLKN